MIINRYRAAVHIVLMIAATVIGVTCWRPALYSAAFFAGILSEIIL